jgi:hypothetical protein
MSERVVADLGEVVREAVCEAEPDMVVGVVGVVGVAGLRLREHSKHTSAVAAAAVALLVAGTVEVHIEVAGIGLGTLRLETCCDASPQPHLPASSSRSCACSVGVLGSLPRQSRGLQR